MIGHKCADAEEAVEYLKRRIAVEKADEPRRNFVKDHRIIHDRKKHDVCIPILPGHDQEAWFDKLDSNGIWVEVLGYLTKPSDMTSAYFSCEMFRKHMENRRKMTLLPKVFGVLRDTGRFEYTGFDDNPKDKKKTDNREILKLRLVSKSWKKLVDEEFLMPLKISPSQPAWDPESWIWESPMVCSFENVTDVDKALEKLQNPKSCASLVRLMFVEDKNCADKETFYSKIAEFLDIHGESVWGLLSIQQRSSTSKYYNYEGLWNMVSRTPHLKDLSVNDSWICADYNQITPDELRDGNARLMKMISQNPFPTIPSLELCEFDFYPVRNEILVAEILSRNSSVKGVGFDDSVEDEIANDVGMSISSFVWDVLGNLRLEYFYFSHRGSGEVFENDFQRLKHFDWPLKVLRVAYSYYHVVDFGEHVFLEMHAPNMFSALSRFNASLMDFDFFGGDMFLVHDGRTVTVDFPKLKKIDTPEIMYDY